jgi:hypothetical protein
MDARSTLVRVPFVATDPRTTATTTAPTTTTTAAPIMGSTHTGKESDPAIGKYPCCYKYTDTQPDPQAYTPMTKLCDLAEQLGESRNYATRLCGGDNGNKTKPLAGFEPLVWGKRKYVANTCFDAMAALHKATHKA